ncbi:MAG: replication protein, partial [Chloroflexota bacterium]|nr:replication protein [Chloroflexota bacterium]
MPELPPLQFGGFDAPHYTQVPDALFDELLPYLSEAELKVLLYIIRRTFGFKKAADPISVAQMVHGIVTRDGRRLDWGAGCSESSIKRGVRGLLDKNLIARELRRSAERGDEAPVYRLRLRSDRRGSESTPPGGQNDPQGSESTPPGDQNDPRRGVTTDPHRGPESTPQETAGQETAGQETESNPILSP